MLNKQFSNKNSIELNFRNIHLLLKEKKFLSLYNENLSITNKNESLILATNNGAKLNYIHELSFEKNYNDFLRIAIQITNKVKQLHHHGLLHGNLNDYSILLDENEEVFICNFTHSVNLSQKPAELSPILFKNISTENKSPEMLGKVNNIIDLRTDIYSLGLLFYQMLLNHNPYKGNDELNSYNKVLTTSIKNGSKIPKSIYRFLDKLLQKDIAQRYQSINGVLHDLELLSQNYLDEIVLCKRDLSSKLQLSDKVYGREKELNLLINRYYDVCKGYSKTVFVGGYSGIGKTVLISELKNKIISTDTYCVSSKFDQYNKGKPYFGIKEAFHALAQQILLKPEDELELLKQEILDVLSGNGKIVTDLVPSFEEILGVQNDVQKLPANENENRFHQVFLNLLKVISTQNTPLLLIIDDLQWIDFATLNLLDSFIKSDDLSHLYLLCSYRDNEVENNVALANILNKNKKIELIKINPLDKNSLGSFLEDTLFLPKAQMSDLVEEIYLKTGANPFFFKQFIHGLYEEGLIYFDEKKTKWAYDIQEIKKENITENIADYLLKRGVSTLEKNTLHILQIAAALGATFDLKVLQKIDNIAIDSLIKNMHEIYKLGYLLLIDVSIDELVYFDEFESINIKFLHDQFQQAIYSTIEENEQSKLHYKIGIALLNLPNTEISCFDILSHLNKSIKFFESDDEKLKLIELNKKALYQAKESTAYSSALTYTLVARELIKTYNLSLFYDQFLELELNYIELLYLIGSIKEGDNVVENLFPLIKTSDDEIKLRRLLTIQYTRIGRLSEAVKEGINSLNLLGVHIKNDTTMNDVGSEIEEVGKMIAETPFSKLAKLPKIENKKTLQTLDILMEMQAASYNSGSLVFPITILRLLKITILEGNSYLSSYVYMMYALMNTKVLKNYDMAFEAAKYAKQLQVDTKNDLLIARFNMMHANFVLPWQNKIMEANTLREKAYNQCLACGDYYWGIHSLIFGFYADLMTTNSLDTLLIKTRSVAKLSKKIEQISQYYLCNIQINFIQLLNGEVEYKKVSNEYTILEEEALKEYNQQNYMCGKYDFIISKLIHGYMFEEYEDALKISLNDNIDESSLDEGIFHEAFYKVFNILSILSLKIEGKTNQKYESYLNSNLPFIEIWCNFSPDIFQPIKLLIDALIQTTKQNTNNAIEYFEKAINESYKVESIFLQAIVSEEYGKFWERRENKKVSTLYFEDAIDLYSNYGAHAKVKKLLSKITSFTTTKDAYVDLDIDVIMKSSNILSREIELNKVVENVLKLVLEISGAENGFIYFDELEQKFIANLANDELTIFKEKESFNQTKLPLSILSYVKRTRETLHINNIHDYSFTLKDNYIMSKQPKSILCMPLIHNNEINAIIYLENYMSKNIFLSRDIETIKYLSHQIVLSIEKSLFFKQLEEKVAEKTKDLQEANERLEKISITDALTNIYNRRHFNELFPKIINSAKRDNDLVSFLIMDIDHFKQYNDTYGHQMGDDVLVKVAKAIKDSIYRSDDYCFRLGGEEFGVIFKTDSKEKAFEFANKIKENIENLNIEHKGNSASSYITASMGLICKNAKDIPSDDIVYKEADDLLYKAKENGRNKVCYESFF